MLTISINYILKLTRIVFFIGLVGIALNRKNILIIMSIELLLLAIANFLLIDLLVLLGFINFICSNASNKNFLQETSFFFTPNSWQKSIETISEITPQLISDIISIHKEKYFPRICLFLLNCILFSNLIGLVPYSFTAISHLIMTFILLFSVFIGVNIIVF